MRPTKIDLLLNCKWIIPIVPENQTLTDCAIAIDNGKIIGLLPQAEAARRFSAVKVQDLDHHIVMPGLVNSHGHAAMSLLRGYADDLPLRSWLENHIWPAEAKFLSEEFVRDGTRLSIAEMIRSGTTCFADMYFFDEAIATEVRNSGVRSQISFTVLDFPTPYGKNADDYIHKGLALRDNCKDQPLIKIACAPHAPYSVSDRALSICLPLQGWVTMMSFSYPALCQLSSRQGVDDAALSHGPKRSGVMLIGSLLPLRQGSASMLNRPEGVTKKLRRVMLWSIAPSPKGGE